MPNITEELVAQPLPEMIKQLGLAVAEANKAMIANGEADDTRFAIPEASIELNVAISTQTKTEAGVSVTAGIQVASVNASYSKTYDFKEEASSKISIKLKAVPQTDPSE